MKKISSYTIPIVTLVGLMLGLLLNLLSQEKIANVVWLVTMIFGTAPLLYKIVKDIIRGHFGVDLIAILAIITSFVLGQYLAGTVILLMLSGGEALEEYALKRSSKELTKLLSLAPSLGHLMIGLEIKDIAADEIKVNDKILVKPGEIIPVDGFVTKGTSEIDESSITGESSLIEKFEGSKVFSGSINKDSALEIVAEKPAEQSQYQRIVKLVREAQESKAPMVRLADSYAIWFTALTLVLSLSAWYFSGNVIRFLAVLVVATPCPLILATPIAIISGISKSASRGVIIKNGSALEKLGEAKAMAFDKTGTLTLGEPNIVAIKSYNSRLNSSQICELTASLDQLSMHTLARALVIHAKNQKVSLVIPSDFKENIGFGVSGKINGKKYIFGKMDFLKKEGVKISDLALLEHKELQIKGQIGVYLASENEILGGVVFSDVIRPEMKQVFNEIREHKIKDIYMLTGDKREVAKKVSEELGIKNYLAELLPEDKVNAVKDIRSKVSPLVMVGDGVNDAPALAAADVGIALASHGSSVSSESADIVIMQNSLMRLHDAIHIAQKTIYIAKESIFIGLGLSIVLMFIAAFGYIKPIYGALLQEAIDVAVILNALRVNFQKID